MGISPNTGEVMTSSRIPTIPFRNRSHYKPKSYYVPGGSSISYRPANNVPQESDFGKGDVTNELREELNSGEKTFFPLEKRWW